MGMIPSWDEAGHSYLAHSKYLKSKSDLLSASRWEVCGLGVPSLIERDGRLEKVSFPNRRVGETGNLDVRMVPQPCLGPPWPVAALGHLCTLG